VGGNDVKTLTQLVDDASTTSPRTNQVGMQLHPAISTTGLVLLKVLEVGMGKGNGFQILYLGDLRSTQ
jgi:hypothetical protein